MLLLTDPIDEFWVPSVARIRRRRSNPRRAAARISTRSQPAEDKQETAAKPEPPAKLASLIAILKLALGEAVKMSVHPSG